MSTEVLLASTSRQRLTLSSRPLGQGGQATVFSVDADPSLVVKLYHEPTAEIERRLESMLLLAHPDEFLLEDGTGHPALTWPSAMVTDVDSGQVIGYAMRRIGEPDFLPLGTLFNAIQRRRHFPDISWRFLVGLARNLAGLTAAIHDRELVLGDVSHANIMVSRNGYLSFLDCDSMQFTDPRSGERFLCEFLTPEYAAPELHRDAEQERSAATDNFSLAVLVCQLLLPGDSPHRGIRLGGDDNHADTAQNIIDGYSYLVHPEEMRLPAGTLDPALLPPPVLRLARRAFGDGHIDQAARPRAEEWLAALDDAMASIAVCGEQRYHAYSDHLPACPWCGRVQSGLGDVFSSPEAPRPAPSTPPRHVLAAAAEVAWRQWLIALAFIAVIVLLVVAA
jgi:DNA-binding helix-hairpin-helix protein with protein kinase domain